jgi:integrase
MEQFVQHKQACGYKYGEAVRILARFDRSLCDGGLSQCELPRALSWQWLAKQAHESASTHRGRIRVVRQFALYMRRLGYPADVPDRSLTSKCSAGFSPRILTPGEVRQLLHAVDQLTATARAPLRHLIMPEVFRLLYGCGFRLNEVLRLRVADVDLDRGIVTVREAKFGKDRLVPPASALVELPAKVRRWYGLSLVRCLLLSGAIWRSVESDSGLFAVPRTAASVRDCARRSRQGTAHP